MYTCAKCKVYACRGNQAGKLPKNCPIRNQEILNEALEEYKKEENIQFYITSAEIERLGYGQWVRVRETMEFCDRMGYHRIGLAFCGGLCGEAEIVSDLLTRHGFQVVSIICKAGGVDKSEMGIKEEYKMHPNEFEPMCNPVFQARLLNEQKTDFNIALGLCVGHDSFLYRYSEAMVTTLVVKDRVLAHNPAGAIYCAKGYYKNKFGDEG